jgi:hypothetical protein
LIRAGRVNIALALATLVVGLGLVLVDDNTSWSRGYGYDGRLYGDLAEHFPGAVFGDDGVIPPGYGRYTGERPQGIDAYYVRRILPSAVVFYSLSALSIDKTHGNVIAAFEVWTALLVALVAFLWCLCADRLGLDRQAKLFGLIALLVNFAILKGAFYYPVLTDTFAFALAMASLYFWLSNRTLALAAATFLIAFTWPRAVPVGIALLLFPPGKLKLDRAPLSFAAGRRRASILKLSAAAIPSLALLGYLIHLRATGSHAPQEIPHGVAFAFAAVIAAAFVFGALLFLVPDLSRRQLRGVARSMLSGRALLVVGVVGSALVLQAVIAERPGFYNELDLLRFSVWYSALDPGIFLVAMIGFFGPLLALTVLEWPRVCRQIHSLGSGATLVAVYFIPLALLTESRKSIALYPFAVLFTVLACQRLLERRWFLPAFAGVSIVASLVWLRIGEFGLVDAAGLRHFPAQKYFMSSGLWTSSDMYLAQLAGAVLVIAMLVAFRRRAPGPLAGAAAAPAPRAAP